VTFLNFTAKDKNELKYKFQKSIGRLPGAAGVLDGDGRKGGSEASLTDRERERWQRCKFIASHGNTWAKDE
jgi:hypothetical protein